MQKINQKGLNLVKEFEGLRLESYLCPAGVPTIGYGRTKGVKLGQKITEEIADRYLKEDLNYFEGEIDRLAYKSLNANQFSALVSFAYNVGVNAFAGSTLLTCLNANRFNDAANEFDRWNKANGRVLEGLVRRRAAEKKLFLEPELLTSERTTGMGEGASPIASSSKLLTSSVVAVRFEMTLKPSNSLLWGHLRFLDDRGNGIAAFVATSGAAGFQTAAHFRTKGRGCIPPAKNLLIQTSPFSLPHIKGVEGDFFPVGNLRGGSVYSIEDWGRADIGIHFDGNAPGSAGCIVVQNRNSFETKVAELLKNCGKDYLPIEIKYS